jgi:hypothetical protein
VDLALRHADRDGADRAGLAEERDGLQRRDVVQLGERAGDGDLAGRRLAAVVDERDGVERVGALDGLAVVVGVDDRVAPGLADLRARIVGGVLAEVVAALVAVAREEPRAVVEDVLVVLLDDDGGNRNLPPDGLDGPSGAERTRARTRETRRSPGANICATRPPPAKITAARA